MTELKEVASPDKTGSVARLVRKPTQWTNRTAQVVAAVVIARTATAEADGVMVRILCNPMMTTK